MNEPFTEGTRVRWRYRRPWFAAGESRTETGTVQWADAGMAMVIPDSGPECRWVLPPSSLDRL